MTAVAATHKPRLQLWVFVVAGGVITALSLGVRSTFGLLLEPIAEGLGSGLGPIAFAIAVQNLMWGFSQPLAGALSDRFGAPAVLSAGGVLYALALLLMATADGTGAILLTGGFLTGIAVGAASFAVVLSAVGRNAPPERRSLLLGLVSAIGSLGQFVLIPVAQGLLQNVSWQQTSVVLAIVLVPIIFIAPLMRSRVVKPGDTDGGEVAVTEMPKQPLRADLRKAARSRSYLLLNTAFFTCGFHVTFIGVHLPGFVNVTGLSASTASTALALIGLFNVVGSLLVGVLGQRIAFTYLLAGIYGLRAVSIGIFFLMPITTTTVIVFGIVMGVLWLSTVPPTSAIVTQLFGPANAGALFGVVFLSHQLGSFLGAWLGGEIFDATESYSIMWVVVAILGLYAMFVHLFINESPIVDEPQKGGRRGGIRWGSATAAIALVIAGTFAGASLTAEAAARESTGEVDRRPVVTYCALGPSLHSSR